MKQNVHGAAHAVAADGAVDWDHPLNRGLNGLWLPGLPGTPAAGSRVLNLANPRGQSNGTLNAGTSWVGRALRVTANGGGVTVPNTPLNPGTGDFSVLVDYAATAGGGTAWATLVTNNTSGNQDGFVLGSNGANKLRVNLNLSYVSVLNGARTAFDAAGTRHVAVFTRQGATFSLYLDGVLDASSSSGTTSSLSTSTTGSFGTQPGDSSRTVQGAHYQVCAWNRCLSAAEADNATGEALLGNPTRLRWVSTRTWFVRPLAAGGGAALFPCCM